MSLFKGLEKKIVRQTLEITKEVVAQNGWGAGCSSDFIKIIDEALEKKYITEKEAFDYTMFALSIK